MICKNTFVWQCLHRHVLVRLCLVCLSVKPLQGHTIHPSPVALPVSCSGRGLTLWNACCHLSSITTCCCTILPALYCLGFILDKSRKALRFVGLGWV